MQDLVKPQMLQLLWAWFVMGLVNTAIAKAKKPFDALGLKMQ